ncbi:MAG: single-stranded DNA-binding protein [Bradymonadaceae bacterium]
MSVNKAIIVGNLGADPEVRSTGSDTTVANFRVASNRVYTDSNGEQQQETEWHRIVVFGRQAENCDQYLSKGSQVYIEGRIQTRGWEDNNGKDRYTTEIVANNVQFLSGGKNGGSGSQSGQPPPPEPRGDFGGSNDSGGGDSGDDEPFDDEEIPF